METSQIGSAAVPRTMRCCRRSNTARFSMPTLPNSQFLHPVVMLTCGRTPSISAAHRILLSTCSCPILRSKYLRFDLLSRHVVHHLIEFMNLMRQMLLNFSSSECSSFLQQAAFIAYVSSQEMQGVENASALVEDDARASNTKWMEHLDASGLHLSVPFELLCCGVRDVREIVSSVFSPSDGDARYAFVCVCKARAAFCSDVSKQLLRSCARAPSCSHASRILIIVCVYIRSTKVFYIVQHPRQTMKIRIQHGCACTHRF